MFESDDLTAQCKKHIFKISRWSHLRILIRDWKSNRAIILKPDLRVLMKKWRAQTHAEGSKYKRMDTNTKRRIDHADKLSYDSNRQTDNY